MKPTQTLSALAVASALTAALIASTPSRAADTEQCYGVAMKGQNDCKAGAHDCKGMSKADYDGKDFKLVPTGTCTTMKTPDGKMGTLKPVEM